jgi:hypothetical protein
VVCFGELGIPGYLIWIMMLVITNYELRAVWSMPVKTETDFHLQRYAAALQLAFYGFLASAWFLSRTYVVTLYILIALSSALAALARREGSPVPQVPYSKLFGHSTGYAALAIALVYLTIRFQVR